MTQVEGFTLLRQEELSELASQAYLYRHNKTGAEVLSITNEDTNKVFGINFRTPPADSTGVAHILEHSVLCGSRKYPLKEPFVELIKSSVNTFLNAMTYPDKTVYPVASENLKDFYNLTDVYLDAVLNPLITRNTFEQEGWHYDLEEVDQPLKYKGVVFNEMKGAYSSPDRLLYEESQRSLFNGHIYGVSSGGHPRNIPDLTYEDFSRFHQTYYHPSNARIFFYGDDDPERRLMLLKEYLDEFSARPVDSEVPLQPTFDDPRRIVSTYAVSPEAAETSKSMMTVNWLLDDSLDFETSMGLSLLDHVLLGTPASPLYKALIGSGLGERLTGGGLHGGLRQLSYSIGLKGIQADDVEKVEALIQETLEELVRDGIEDDAIEASLNTIEFSLRENNTGSYPRGLVVMLRALSTWLYDGDPLERLHFEEPLSDLKAKLAETPMLEELIQSRLLNNPSRTTVVLHPDPEHASREEQAELERLKAYEESLSPEQRTQLVERTRELQRLQAEPDSPELLAKLPTLTLGDMRREIEIIPTERSEDGPVEILHHDLFTGGIVYFDLAFNLHNVPERLLPYIPLFGRALTDLGTPDWDRVALSRRIGRTTGGVWAGRVISSVLGEQQSVARFLLRGKAMAHQASEMTAIMQEVLTQTLFDNQARLREMVLEQKASLEARLIPAGHSMVSLRLGARFNEAGWAAEQMGGIAQLLFLRQLAERLDSDWSGVLADLEELRAILVNRTGALANVTADADTWSAFQPTLSGFLAELPAADATNAPWRADTDAPNEGLLLPAQVNYVGAAANLYDLGYTYHGSAAVITRYLGTSWLWEKVRVQGGAYGGFCNFSRMSGLMRFLSYRDPNLKKTLDNYAGTADFLQKLDLDEQQLSRAIIGTVGDMDSYQLPDAKGYSAMLRHLLNVQDDERQRIRDEILNTRAEHFHQFGDVLHRFNEHVQTVVLGSADAITAFNDEHGGDLTATKVL
ncbi:MAG: peptidase M16 [Myxococcales bacterium]|nr:peptidase M16 [Myxococcales bacterium]